MTEEIKHTPLPWRIGYHSDEIAHIDSNDDYSFGDVAVCYSCGGHRDQKANAAFIVRAVNNHDALLVHLKKMCHMAMYASPAECGMDQADIDDALEALSIAKGERK